MRRGSAVPPKWAERLFKWYCRNELAESILGDLEEQFYSDLEKSGQFKAKLKYWISIFRFCNRYTLTKYEKRLYQNSGYQIMFRHYLLTSYRNLRKHKIYTFINISGLVIGLASCLLIANFLNNELSFDKFHDKSDNIYRINHLMTDNSGNVTRMANTPPALVPGIRDLFPEINKATQLRYARRSLLEYGDNRFYESCGFYADSSFLEIFSFPLLAGNKSTALDEPNSILLTSELASKYFGDADPMGKFLTLNQNLELKVTGILESIPANSHLQFDFLMSFQTYVVPENYLSDLTSWSWAGFLSYVLLEDGSGSKVLQDKIDQLYSEKAYANSTPNKCYVQPLEDIYMGSNDLLDDLASGMLSGNKFTIYSLSVVALLILLIAGFNYMNLSVAVSAARFKEAGLRKMLGADRSSLITQMLNESVVLSLLSLLLAYLVSIIAFAYIKDLLDWNFLFNWPKVMLSLPFALLAAFIIGIGAGLYPAIMLSGHNSVAALKNNLTNNFGTGSGLRKVLIALQFCISISLIAATIVITKQFQYMSDEKLGFDEENVVVIKLLPQDMTRYYETFKERLLQNNHFTSVSRSERTMGESWPVNMILEEGRDVSEVKRVLGNQVGYGYLETMGIKLTDGRTFSKEFGNDPTRSVIINQKMVEYLGLENPVGKSVYYFSFDGPRTIIGVVDDFNYLSLHHEISPMALVLPFVDIQNLYVRISPGILSDKIAALQNIWENTNPGVPLEFRFMDDHLNRLYGNEEKLSYLILGFSGLTILLACMGLYGLIAFSLNQRRKEIGIRKVLGATVPSLLIRFSSQYLILICLASLVAVPAVQYILSQWLESFAYRIEISWWIYLLSLLSLIVIALITISHQAISAALVNPVNVLKDE